MTTTYQLHEISIEIYCECGNEFHEDFILDDFTVCKNCKRKYSLKLDIKIEEVPNGQN